MLPRQNFITLSALTFLFAAANPCKANAAPFMQNSLSTLQKFPGQGKALVTALDILASIFAWIPSVGLVIGLFLLLVKDPDLIIKKTLLVASVVMGTMWAYDSFVLPYLQAMR